jgi:hypothetical protein
MPSPNFPRYRGWAAILTAVATLLMLITAIVSSIVNLGPTFNLLVIAFMGLILVVALALHLVLRSQAPVLGPAAAGVGILGALLTAIAHVLQLTDTLTDARFNTLGEGFGPGAIGIWLLLANYLALRGRVLPTWLAWVGLVAGAGYLMSGAGALIGGPMTVGEGPQNPLSSVGPLGIFIVYPVWAIWLGRWMLRQSRPVAASKAESLHKMP